jgi:hypothetical protein
VESWEALVIVDSRGTRLLTIPVSVKPSARRCGRQILLSRDHGLTLARAILRMANTEGK